MEMQQMQLSASNYPCSIGDDDLAIAVTKAMEVLKTYISIESWSRYDDLVDIRSEGNPEITIAKITDPDELEEVTGCAKKHLPADCSVIIIMGLSGCFLSHESQDSIIRQLNKIGVCDGGDQ